MSGLERLFDRAAGLLAQGLRGPALGQAFREAFDPDASAHLAELQGLVAAALRRLGLSEWSGARLGPALAAHPRLADPECLAQLAFELVLGDGSDGGDPDGLGWLAGPLLRGSRLAAYLRAAEEDPGKAMAYLNTNLQRELQARRVAADPEGAALYDDLIEAGRALDQAGAGRLEGARLVLPTGGAAGTSGAGARCEDLELVQAALLEGGHLEPFLAAVERNATRTGGRNTPLRGATFVEPLVAGLAACAAGLAVGELALDLSALANRLRSAWPLPPELRTHGLPTDEDGAADPGALGPDLGALDPALLVEAGPAAIGALLGPWRAALATAPSLAEARREKLAGYLDALELELRDGLGELAPTWRADLRTRLGIKPQTWSDDWKALDGLLLGALEAGR